MKELFCRPKWYGVGFPYYPAHLTRYQAIKIPKDGKEAEDVFAQKYLDNLPEEHIWKIITKREPVYRSEEDFKEEFDIVE